MFTFGSNSGIQGNGTQTNYTFVTPEVSTYFMLGSGLAVFAFGAWRRKKLTAGHVVEGRPVS